MLARALVRGALAERLKMAASSAPPAQPVVVVSQNIYASTLSYLQGRGLQVQSVPVEEHASAQARACALLRVRACAEAELQTYATLWERVPGASGLLTFPEDVVDGPLLKQAGPQLVAVSVCGERCALSEPLARASQLPLPAHRPLARLLVSHALPPAARAAWNCLHAALRAWWCAPQTRL